MPTGQPCEGVGEGVLDAELLAGLDEDATVELELDAEVDSTELAVAFAEPWDELETTELDALPLGVPEVFARVEDVKGVSDECIELASAGLLELEIELDEDWLVAEVVEAAEEFATLAAEDTAVLAAASLSAELVVSAEADELGIDEGREVALELTCAA